MRAIERIVALLLVLAAGSAAAAGPAGAGARVGISAGVLASRFADGNGNLGGLEREPRRAWGGLAGLVAEQALGSGFALAAGLEYAETPDVARVTHHGLQFFNGGTAYEARTLWTIRQHALLLPLRVEYRRGPLRVGLGPQLRYLLSAARTSSEFEWVETGSLVPSPNAPRPAPTAQIFEDVGTFDGAGDATSLYERCTLSALASLGVAWPAGGHELRAELRGWTDATRATKDLGGGEKATTFQLVLAGLW